jgi:hypothetical protein
MIPTFTSVGEVDKIAAIQNPVIRNLRITDSYCKLSAAMATRLSPNANWCTFATWASKQAGQTIRGEDVRRTAHAALQNDPEIMQSLMLIAMLAKQLGANQTHQQIKETVLAGLIKSAAERASDAVARGNKKVFEEIGREFARFLTHCFNDEVYNQTNINNFCSGLRAGDPPNGQEYLQRAFKQYYVALFETGQKKRAELCLLANLEIGYHEQTRLQPEIMESLNAAMPHESLSSFLFNILFPGQTALGKMLSILRSLTTNTTMLKKEISVLIAKAQQHIRRIITAELMTLTMPPSHRLHLGHDLVATFPLNLQQPENPELVNLLVQIDPTQNSLTESGATDWADLKERLHYIADLFRSYHEKKELFTEAFTPQQLELINAGKLPGGEL